MIFKPLKVGSRRKPTSKSILVGTIAVFMLLVIGSSFTTLLELEKTQPQVPISNPIQLTVCPYRLEDISCSYFGIQGIQQAIDNAPSNSIITVADGIYQSQNPSAECVLSTITNPAKSITLSSPHSAILQGLPGNKICIYPNTLHMENITVKTMRIEEY
ncbi:hypothetical protein KC717_01175 [Candidatus Dojkabacteria bacterium]|uniref:Uncharacterized protein n=1 Tax=Candidatus Dojkabacteria bacterium TaxID=2099670 RepID=A0A955L780_9BACT|nr:hypothetical protein [Candidatus Dojkabacteria bacterium]